MVFLNWDSVRKLHKAINESQWLTRLVLILAIVSFNLNMSLNEQGLVTVLKQ